MKYRKSMALAFLAVCILASMGRGTQTAFWSVDTFRGFLKGQLQGVSANMNGDLRLAPQTQSVFTPGETVALSMALGRDGNIFVGTGHQGKVFEIDSGMHGKLLFQAQQPEILALAVGPDGDLYAASSPEGKIYRITPSGTASVFCDPEVKYIWALAFDSKGQLYAGTGDRGEILRIDRDGKGSVFFESDQTHIMCLAFDKDGNLLAGSEPGGLIYRITPQGKAFVLYQANLPEIYSLAIDAQGRIYAAALGNATPQMAPGAFGAEAGRPVVAGTATVTVIAEHSSARDPSEAQVAPHNQNQKKTQPMLAAPGTSSGFGVPFRATDLGRGELIQILPDEASQVLWSSNRASIFGLATRAQDVLFSTDSNGHIFDLQPSPDGPQLTLLTETRTSLPTRILASPSQIFVATSNIAKLIRVGSSVGNRGVYVSPVKDAKFISRWGEIAWRAELPSGCSLAFYTRSGNSARPDRTWSEWMGPYINPEGSPVKNPPARYAQWKAVLQGSDGQSPVLRKVTLAYLNENLPPEIQSLTVINGAQKLTLSGTPFESPGPAINPPYNSVSSPTLTAQMYDPSPSYGSDPSGKPPVEISWSASDPNKDRLAYSLYMKSSQEQQWHLVKRNLRSNNFSIPQSSLANGEYRLKLVASDSPSNPPARALQTSLVSGPFWVDNTPPVIQVLSTRVDGNGAVVRFAATTAGAPLRKAEVSTGDDHWRDILSDDGIVDSRRETFTVTLQHLSIGEHVVTLRTYDTAGNVGIGQAMMEIR